MITIIIGISSSKYVAIIYNVIRFGLTVSR